MLTDVPIGALIIATVLDVVGQSDAAAWAIGVGILSMLGAALAGYADYLDLEGAGKRVGSLHSTSMLAALVLYVISLGARLGWWPLFEGGAEWTAGIGLVLVLVGGYLGGELVFNLGSQVPNEDKSLRIRYWNCNENPNNDVFKTPDGSTNYKDFTFGDKPKEPAK